MDDKRRDNFVTMPEDDPRLLDESTTDDENGKDIEVIKVDRKGKGRADESIEKIATTIQGKDRRTENISIDFSDDLNTILNEVHTHIGRYL